VRIPESVIKEVAEKADILSVVSNYTALRQQGGRFWGLCPFHTEKTPSFTVTPENNMFYCFGCHKGGTIFSFLMEKEGLSFLEAVETLGRQAGVDVRLEEGISGEELRSRDALTELFRRTAGSFHYVLVSSPAGQAAAVYLERRGIRPETVEKFQLGFAPSDAYWLHPFLVKKGYSEEFLASSGLFSRDDAKRAFFAGRVMFPIFSAKGDVIAFGGRILDPNASRAKYLNSGESAAFKKGQNLYGFFQARAAIREERTAVVAEGYMDVISLHQAGIKNAVAPLGTAFTQEQGRLLRRFADTLVLFFDSDEAGQKAVRRSAEICEALEFAIKVVMLPEGKKDPADFIQEGRVEELQNIVKCSIPILDYFLKKYMEDGAPGGVKNEEAILRDIEPYIGSIVSPVRRDLALRSLSELLGVDKKAIAGDFRRRAVSPVRAIPETEKNEGRPALTPEILLLMAAIDNKDAFSTVRARLSPEDFTEAETRAVFVSLEDSYRNGNWNTAALLEAVEHKPLKEFIVEKLASGEFAQNRDKMVGDAIRSIRIGKFEREQREVERQLKNLNFATKESEAKITELLETKMYLDGELKKLKDNRE
jgi:DNA primase